MVCPSFIKSFKNYRTDLTYIFTKLAYIPKDAGRLYFIFTKKCEKFYFFNN